MSDPLFQSEMFDMLQRVENEVLSGQSARENRDALEILEEASSAAAQFCVDLLNDKTAGPNLKAKTAWDILDRTKGKPVQRQITASVSIVDLIIQAGEEIDREDNLDARSGVDRVDARMLESAKPVDDVDADTSAGTESD